MVEAIRLQSRRPEKQESYLQSLLELAIKQKNPIIRLGIMISLLPPLMLPLGGKERTSPTIHMAALLLSFLFRNDGKALYRTTLSDQPKSSNTVWAFSWRSFCITHTI